MRSASLARTTASSEIRFDPDITIGVWVGYDQKKALGYGQSGAEAALPIWMDIMRTWIARQRATLPEPPHFERPGNVVLVTGADGTRAYIAGTEPGSGRSGPAFGPRRASSSRES